MAPGKAPRGPRAVSGLDSRDLVLPHRASSYQLRTLVGPGFYLAAVGALALGLMEATQHKSWGSLFPDAARALMLLSVALAAIHLWLVHRNLDRATTSSRDLIRHRLIVVLIGAALTAAAWAGRELHEGHEAAAAACLLVLGGLGATSAAADRLTLILWLSTSIMIPAIAMVTHDGLTNAPLAGAVLLAGGLVVSFMAVRIRQLLIRSWNSRVQNEKLVGELRQQVVLVESANHEKSRFLGAASHDLRQPMHALGLFAAALERELRGMPQYPSVISMKRAVDALEQSFSAMLDISRIDAGVVHANLQAFPIREVFRRLHMHSAGLAGERGIFLRFKPGGKLVTSDAQLLERILGNLVQNAIRYTEQGGVVVVARTRREHISLEVWDTGIGVAQHELPKIFNEFYQVSNPGRDRSRGLGMGLSIVKRLVDLLGYELEVKSKPGRGTVFKVVLPATQLAEMHSVVLGADTVPSVLVDDRTVLVIDDEASVLEGMRKVLEGWGYTVLTADSGVMARTRIRQHAGIINVIVSDLRLGGGEDGIQAIESLRKEYGAPLPAILVTGDTSPDEVKRAHGSGFPVLFKPVPPRALFAALRGTP